MISLIAIILDIIKLYCQKTCDTSLYFMEWVFNLKHDVSLSLPPDFYPGLIWNSTIEYRKVLGTFFPWILLYFWLWHRFHLFEDKHFLKLSRLRKWGFTQKARPGSSQCVIFIDFFRAVCLWSSLQDLIWFCAITNEELLAIVLF